MSEQSYSNYRHVEGVTYNSDGRNFVLHTGTTGVEYFTNTWANWAEAQGLTWEVPKLTLNKNVKVL